MQVVPAPRLWADRDLSVRLFIRSLAESILSGFSHSAQAAEPSQAGACDTLGNHNSGQSAPRPSSADDRTSETSRYQARHEGSGPAGRYIFDHRAL